MNQDNKIDKYNEINFLDNQEFNNMDFFSISLQNILTSSDPIIQQSILDVITFKGIHIFGISETHLKPNNASITFKNNNTYKFFSESTFEGRKGVSLLIHNLYTKYIHTV